MKSTESGGTARTKASEHDADWYNEFYQTRQEGLAPWYRFLLPELQRDLRTDQQLLELGCGQAHVLRLLSQSGMIAPENLTGIDQSQAAIDFSSRNLPKAHFKVDDIYVLGKLGDAKYDACLLMETIEHLENPEPALASIRRVLKPGARVYVSFPNYVHLPWLLVRILAEKLNRPNWIVLQPVDKIYTVFTVIKLFEQAGFVFNKGIGSNYGPPVLYPLETDGMTRLMNKLRLWWLSFHPILVFTKS